MCVCNRGLSRADVWQAAAGHLEKGEVTEIHVPVHTHTLVPTPITTGLAKKLISFYCKMALIALIDFNFRQNNFVRLFCVSCLTNVHSFKQLSKLVNFCVAILILKMKEKNEYFRHIMLN